MQRSIRIPTEPLDKTSQQTPNDGSVLHEKAIPCLKTVTMPSPIRTTVLISGNGSNLQAVIDQVAAGTLDTTLVRVISNRKDAFGLERARKANIPTQYHNLVQYKKQQPATPEGVQAAREAYDAELARLILADQPDLVVCLGFMHILSPQFLSPLEQAKVRIINLHPALPGAFNGVVSSSIFSTMNSLECPRDGFGLVRLLIRRGRMRSSGPMPRGWRARLTGQA